MATLRRGLVDKVKKTAEKVRARGLEVAAKAGTQGARALVETSVAAVKTVDQLKERLSRLPAKASAKLAGAATKAQAGAPSDRPRPAPRAQPVEPRQAGRKTVPAAAPKRAKAAKASGFKVKRGQKHRHAGRHS
jgi:hypothetical protein